MQDGRNLPGVTKKSFSLFYNGGEIWCEHLDGIHGYTDIAVEKLNIDYEVLRKPSKPGFIAINVAETKCEEKLLDAVCEKLTSGEKKIMRVVFVGVPIIKKSYIRNKLTDAGFEFEFINDFEKAKHWLIP